MADVYLGLGSNLGDKRANLRAALRLLAEHAHLIQVSSLYRTVPVGYLDQDWFLNAVARFQTELAPREFLRALLEVEVALGRVRTFPNAPRAIDLDILLWDDLVLDAEELKVPHPRMHERAFVLVPLAEIAPQAHHPVLGRDARRAALIRSRARSGPAARSNPSARACRRRGLRPAAA
jgi:2-amino-4-hydroxy-6-hydroxymethyldihydropteridine diphosphokinase